MIGVKTAAAGAIVGIGIAGNRVSAGCALQLEGVAVLLTSGEFTGEQVSRAGRWSAAGRRAKFSHGDCELAELGIVLSLGRMDGGHLLDNRQFIGAHPCLVHLW